MNMVKPLVLLALCVGPVCARAQDDAVAPYRGEFEACYGAAEDGSARAACVGKVSGACMTGEEGGETTLGMSMCMAAETELWDGVLNAEYRETMDFAKAMDADEAQLFPEFAGRAEALREAQRAWVAFRDAECRLAYAQWGSGSMRHIAGSECMMRMTAERALELRDMRETF
jgi:uncharacterized protein YecT (DUF1311 family)